MKRSCIAHSPRPGQPEHYSSTISKFDVDIGYTSGGVLVWTVFAPNPARLPGDYVGATGGGVGANVLVGGSGQSISLQPVSIEGKTGLNVATGIGAKAYAFASGDTNIL